MSKHASSPEPTLPRLVFFHENFLLGGDSFYLRDLLEDMPAEEYALVYGGCEDVCRLFRESAIPAGRRRRFRSFSREYCVQTLLESGLPRLIRAALIRLVLVSAPLLHLALRYRLRRLLRAVVPGSGARVVVNAGGFKGTDMTRQLPAVLDRKLCCILHNYVEREVLSDSGTVRRMTEGVVMWIVGSGNLKGQIVNECGVPSERVHHIPYGLRLRVQPETVDRNLVRRGLGLDETHFVVLHPSVFEKRKGHRFTLEGFRALRGRCANARLVIAGDRGDDRGEVERLVERLALSESVIFAGFYEPLEDLVTAVDVLCLPTQELDTTPLSVVMGLACGTPVVTTDRKDFEGILRDHVNALLVPRGDAEAVGKALCVLAEDPELGKRLAEAGRITWKDVFDFGRMVARTREVLLSVPHE